MTDQLRSYLVPCLSLVNGGFNTAGLGGYRARPLHTTHAVYKIENR